MQGGQARVRARKHVAFGHEPGLSGPDRALQPQRECLKFYLFRVSLIVACTAGMAVCFGTASPAFAERDVRAAVEQSVRSLKLQTEMPDMTAAARSRWFDFHLSPDLARVVLWGAVVLGALVVVWSLRDSLPVWSRSRKIAARDEIVSSTPAGRLEDAQVEADDLARDGQYSEAMHVLLFKSLNEIHRQLGVSFAVSLTSREILRRIQLSDIGRNALAAIIVSVERTYFGGRPASQADYSDCRSNFDVLRHSLATLGA
jgi:hypothetical protein